MKLNKYIFENTNINFLLGSGASVPFLGTLKNIENWLTELEKDNTLERNKKNKLKAFFYKKYFEIAMKNNMCLIHFLDYIQSKNIKFFNSSSDNFRAFLNKKSIYNQTINYKLNLVKNNYKHFFD